MILANGFFAGAEIAVVSLRRTRIRQLIEEGRQSAVAVQALRSPPERFLATVQVGITVVGATAAAFGGASIATRIQPALAGVPVIGPHADDVALGLVIAVVSYLSIVFGELVPKSLALRSAESYALLIARPMRTLAWLARPVVWLLTKSSNLVLRPLGDKTTFTEARLSAEELQLLIEEAAKTGSVNPHAGDIAARALEFGELIIAEVMVPRNRMQAIPRSASPEEIKRVLLAEGHSRIPIYEGSLDHIVGYIVVQEVLAALVEGKPLTLDALMRPAFFVPETGKAALVLQDLQRRHLRQAIAVDEHGGVAGLVTLEDLLEELVGELFSEDEPADELIRRQADGSAIVHGHASIREVNRALDLDLPEDDAWTTLAGLSIALAGRIPGRGTWLEAPHGARIEILESSPRLVRLVRVIAPPPPPVEEEEPPA